MADHVAYFIEAVERDRALWRSIDVRLLAVYLDGAWRNLSTQIYLRPMTPEDTARLPHPVHNKLLRAEQHVLPINDLATLLDSISRGTWPTTGPDAVAFLCRQFEGSGSARTPYAFTYCQFHSLDTPYDRPNYVWSGHVLRADGDSCGTIMNRVPGAYNALDAIAQQHEYPFKRFDLLASHVLDTPAPTLGSQNAWCEVFAPFEARIDAESVRLEGDDVHYALLAGSPNVFGEVRLQVIPDPPGTEVPANTVLPEGAQWKNVDEDAWTLEGDTKTDAADGVAFALHCGSQPVQWLHLRKYRTHGRAIPLVVYEHLDAGLELLENWLSGDAKPKQGGQRQHQFEEAVGRLFMLAGWRVDVFHNRQLGDGVDVIAHHPIGRVCAAIECTTGPLNTEKLGKLAVRLSELQSVLPDVEVLGVVATSVDVAGLLVSTVRVATDNDLLVLHRGLLLQLLGRVKAGAGPSEVLDFVKREGSSVGRQQELMHGGRARLHDA